MLSSGLRGCLAIGGRIEKHRLISFYVSQSTRYAAYYCAGGNGSAGKLIELATVFFDLPAFGLVFIIGFTVKRQHPLLN